MDKEGSSNLEKTPENDDDDDDDDENTKKSEEKDFMFMEKTSSGDLSLMSTTPRPRQPSESSIERRRVYLPSVCEHVSSSFDLIGNDWGCEFIRNKRKQRMHVVNLKRKQFCEYSECRGYHLKEHYFSEVIRGVYSVRYSCDGKYLAVGFGSGSIALYNTEDYEEIKKIIPGSEASYPITFICFLPSFNEHIFFATTSEGFVLLYNHEKDELIRIIRQYANEIYCVDVNRTCSHLITSGAKKDVRIYDLNSSMLMTSFKVRDSIGSKVHLYNNYHINRVLTVKFLLDDPNIFLSGGWDKTVRIWDLRLKAGCVGKIRGPVIHGEAVDIRDNIILTGSWIPRNALHLWDIRTRSLIKEITPYDPKYFSDEHYVLTAQFFKADTENDLILVGSLGYKSLDVISLKLNLLLHSFYADKSCVAAHSFGDNISFGGMDSVLNIVNFDMNKS